MPKRNTLPKISEEWVVQKSNPLKVLAESKMTLFHLKVLDTYLARINSHNPEERYVTFLKGELEQMLGLTRIKKTDLDKYLDGLFNTVTIYDDSKPDNFVKIGLFAKAECVRDENGQYQVTLACTQEAMEYIFNIDNIGYLKYRLKSVISLSSRYSYILYIYLADNRFRETWEVPVEELKSILGCEAATYSKFYRFNEFVLSKCYGEINAKTDIRFTYEPIRTGKQTVKVRFTVTSSAPELEFKPKIKPIPPGLEQHLTMFCLTKYPDINPIRADELIQETFSAMRGKPIADMFKYAETVLKQKADNLRKEKSKRQYAYGRSRDLYAEAASRPQSYDLEEFEKMAVNFAEYIDEPQQKIPEPEPVNKKLQSLQEFTHEPEPVNTSPQSRREFTYEPEPPEPVNTSPQSRREFTYEPEPPEPVNTSPQSWREFTYEPEPPEPVNTSPQSRREFAYEPEPPEPVNTSPQSRREFTYEPEPVNKSPQSLQGFTHEPEPVNRSPQSLQGFTHEPEPVNIKSQSLQEFTYKPEPPEPVNTSPQSLREFTHKPKPPAKPKPIPGPEASMADEYFSATVKCLMKNDIVDFCEVMKLAQEVNKKIKIMEESGIVVPPPTDEIIKAML